MLIFHEQVANLRTVHGEVLEGKILTNGSPFAKIQPICLKYFECRAEMIRRFIITKSLVSIYCIA